MGLVQSDQRCRLCCDFQLKPKILALLRVYLHTNTKWVESIHSELQIVDIAALHGGEGESTLRVGLCRAQ